MPRGVPLRDPAAQRQRAGQILDAATECLLRWGYRKVKMDDVALRAGVGKGTLYLHWPTRAELFEAIIFRESADVLGELVEAIDNDPGVAVLHRFVRELLAITLRRPLSRMLFGKEQALVQRHPGEDLPTAVRAATAELLELQQAAGVLQTDLPIAEQCYTIDVLITGFYYMEPFLSAAPDPLADSARLDLIASCLRAALGIPQAAGRPGTASLAPKVAALCMDLRRRFEHVVWSANDHQTRGNQTWPPNPAATALTATPAS